jgi:hypothetical protein
MPIPAEQARIIQLLVDRVEVHPDGLELKLRPDGLDGLAAELRSGQSLSRAACPINASYVRRVLRLTLLAPEIVEAILEGQQAAGFTLAVLMRPFPVGWREQAETLS